MTNPSSPSSEGGTPCFFPNTPEWQENATAASSSERGATPLIDLLRRQEEALRRAIRPDSPPSVAPEDPRMVEIAEERIELRTLLRGINRMQSEPLETAHEWGEEGD